MKMRAEIKILIFVMVALLLTGCVGGLSSQGGTAEVGVYMADTGSSVESLSALELERLEKDGEIEEVWVTPQLKK